MTVYSQHHDQPINHVVKIIENNIPSYKCVCGLRAWVSTFQDIEKFLADHINCGEIK
jgi:hypothetical protein